VTQFSTIILHNYNLTNGLIIFEKLFYRGCSW